MRTTIKKIIYYCFVVTLLFIINSCQKKPEAMFDIDETDYLSGLREHRDLEIYYPVKFINKSTDSESYIWDFGDGNTSNDRNAEHKYENAGIYSVKLTAISENGKKSTDYLKTINVTKRYMTGLEFKFSSDLWGDSLGCFEPSCDTLRSQIFFYRESSPDIVYETPIMPLGQNSTRIAELNITENVIFTNETWKIRFVHIQTSGAGRIIKEYTFNPVTDKTSGMVYPIDITHWYYVGVDFGSLELYFIKKTE